MAVGKMPSDHPGKREPGMEMPGVAENWKSSMILPEQATMPLPTKRPLTNSGSDCPGVSAIQTHLLTPASPAAA